MRHAFGDAGAVDNQHAAAVVFVGLFDWFAVFTQHDVGFGGFLFRQLQQMIVQFLAIGAIDFAHRRGHFAQIAEENLRRSPSCFTLMRRSQVHTQLAAHALQRQADLLLNFRIAGDRFLRFARERHPDARHVNHDRDRPTGQASSAIAAGRRNANSCP